MSQTGGRPFEAGNSVGRGRPRGSRNKRSAQAQQILDHYTEPLVKKCVATALEGDTRALALCMERILPALREPGVHLKLPKLEELKDVNEAVKKVLQGIGEGNITPVEGEKIATILQNYRETIEGRELVARIEVLEKQIKEQEKRLRDERVNKKRSTHATPPAGTHTESEELAGDSDSSRKD